MDSTVETTVETTGTEVASADVVDGVRAQLAALGVEVPGVDKAVTDAIDHAIVTHVPNTRLREEEAPAETDTPAEMTGAPEGTAGITGLSSLPGERAAYSDGEALVPEEQAGLDQNYRWVNDPVSKVMAGKPFADWILHRVPVSWFDAPRIPEESMVVQEQGVSLYGPGTPIVVGKSKMCTIGVVGTDAEGRKVGITAGHCGDPGEKVWSADSWQVGASGTVVASNKLHDYSVVELGSNTQISRTYNNVTVNSLGGPARPGDILCKQGVATGHTCGNVWTSDAEVQISQLCAMVGDSGAPVMAGDRMVGIVSGGVLSDQRFSCRTPLQGQLFMPTVSTSIDSVLKDMEARGGVGAGFRLAD
ncbi:MAG TPA: serine protease [Corynebacterium sp.]|nr:serine protease [Corynebacterium sp.]